MKGIILAAGLGTRLRPITENLPKPLVPIINEPLLGIAIRQFLAAGVSEIGINAHYLHEKISLFLDGYKDTRFKLSVELPEVLGSGGYLPPFKDWLGDEPFLVYNGDILSDIDFKALFDYHNSTDNLVTMLVRPGHNGKDLAVWIDPDKAPNDIKDISKTPPQGPGYKAHTFASAYVTSKKLLEFMPKSGVFGSIPCMLEGKKAGHRLGAFYHEGFWADIGTPESLWEASVAVSKLEKSKQLKILGKKTGDSIPKISPSAQLPKSALVKGDVFIGPNVIVGENSKIENAILLEGAQVQEKEQITNMIVGPGPGGFRLSII